MCLRLASILCHARSDVPAGVAGLDRSGRSALLRLQGPWAETHPRTLHLLGEEVDTWSRSGALRLTLQAR
jgi:exopolyphosphatase/guanosine-5'-triphosphate,3'-diphosphate pyrophosphatase